MMQISEDIIIWYQKNKRDLPWRHTKDPYKIWISEIILQQTRVEQGLAYYNSFIDTFPDVFSLAIASEEQVLKLWQGLGYYSRARNMHHAAGQIVTLYNGRFPDTWNDIIKLKGIGQYSASAILSIAFSQIYPVVDGNVVRVLSRIYGVDTAYDTATGKKKIHELAEAQMSHDEPGTYNQAVMEFGALCCTPKNPSCSGCIFKKKCKALASGTPEDFPVKMAKTAIAGRHYLFMVITSGKGKQKNICLRKRTADGIWKNLYDFPCIETDSQLSLEQIAVHPEWKKLFGKYRVTTGAISRGYIHKLSHIHMQVRFIDVHVPEPLVKKDLVWIAPAGLNKYPVPRLIEKYLTESALL